jgi:hypothetical protein
VPAAVAPWAASLHRADALLCRPNPKSNDDLLELIDAERDARKAASELLSAVPRGGGASVTVSTIVVPLREWADNPCDCDHAEGLVEDDGDAETYLYVCWCGQEWRVAKDDPEVQAAAAAASTRPARKLEEDGLAGAAPATTKRRRAKRPVASAPPTACPPHAEAGPGLLGPDGNGRPGHSPLGQTGPAPSLGCGPSETSSGVAHAPARPLAVPTCRQCGCTDERACAGGCWWVEADVCSQCSLGILGAHVLDMCDNVDCGRLGPDQVGLILPGGEQLGFCSLACFVLAVRRRWIDTPRGA